MRRSAAPHNPGVSLFPFLAVLICTMGVMMLLLVVCNRPGADGGDDNGSGAAEADADTARGVLTWRISQLKTARDKTETDLADRRLRLSAVEEHMGQLRDEWNSLRSAAKNLEQVEHAKGEAVQLTEAQLAQLRQQLEQAKGQVAQTVERRRTEAPSFALVPYEGPNGTRRRPIYIECSRDRVTIQPEGIVLTIEDFEGPAGPGNPLATILRAMRDYLASQGAAGGSQGEPYPLLIVRPDGIELFYGARAAMESWASEFGYELIEQDRKLVYPPPNPQLARVEQSALADARARYAWFAQTRTARKQAEPERPIYRASTTSGGVVRVDHGSGGGEQGSGVGGQGSEVGGQGTEVGGRRSEVGGQGFAGLPAPQFAPPLAAGGSVSGYGNPYGPSGAGGAGGGPFGTTAAGSGFPSGNPGGNFATGAVGNGSGSGNVAGAPGSNTTGVNGVNGGPNGPMSGNQGSGGYPVSGYAVAGSAVNSGTGGGYGTSGDTSATAVTESGANARDGNSDRSSGGSGDSSSNGSSSGAPSNMPSGFNVAMNGTPSERHSVYDDRPPASDVRPHQPGPGEFVDSEHYTPPKPKPDDPDPAKKQRSLADERGRNWSLPSAAKQSVPVSRPIRIECRGDRLIILPDSGNAEPQVVLFGQRTEDSIDKLVAGVWSHTKGWGIAGRQMYWRPSLVLELGPSGEGRFAELQALMANSGLELIRK